MIDTILSIVILALALFVSVAALCRVNYLHFQTHSPLWVCSYAGMAIWAAIEALDAILFTPDGATAIGLAAVGLFLWGSRVSWKEGAPKYLEKAPPCTH